ncbi:GNAT family N-acetyltransferase [Streptomyces boncukensis]|uniref:Acetyltransferase n=1 Tax=Streptomyces boncukensis TaxID=2711219 RepID=A0A6G4XAZ1_9ACTN|nr:GNAT family N-acetyltransferase [Streptomyces boncukensis]NGO74007.1 acetyltransferase [Streptomyces boncukensis]
MSSRSHLLNDRTAERYRYTLTDGVQRVADRLARTDRPFTGVTPAELAPAVQAVDLERPLAHPAAALDELERVHLRDAVYFHHPRYLLQGATLCDVEREFMGLHEGRPAFLMERYDPVHIELAGLYPHQPGDVGMHFLCAPTGTPLRGFSLAVLTTVLQMLFTDPAVRRVVVEPDVRNTAVHALNDAVGFRAETTLTKPEKEALLSFCTREQFQATTGATPA